MSVLQLDKIKLKANIETKALNADKRMSIKSIKL